MCFSCFYAAVGETEGENPRYGPGNPDWEHDRAREDEREPKGER